MRMELYAYLSPTHTAPIWVVCVMSCMRTYKATRVWLHFTFIKSVCPIWHGLLHVAHLSQRLIGELKGYSWSGVRPSVGVVRRRRGRSQCSKIFFSKTALPIKAKSYVEPPWVEGTIFYSRHLGHMTKMAARPIYGKNHSKIFFSRTGMPISTKLGM